MQRLVIRQKRNITWLGGALLVVAFTSHYAFHQEFAAAWALIIASILGALPIALQAFRRCG